MVQAFSVNKKQFPFSNDWRFQRRRLYAPLQLEKRICLAAIGFAENLLSRTEITEPLASVVADIHQDGDSDVFFTSRSLRH